MELDVRFGRCNISQIVADILFPPYFIFIHRYLNNQKTIKSIKANVYISLSQQQLPRWGFQKQIS